MDRFPKGGLIGKCVHAVQTISDLRIPVYAANAGFFIILSLFPALVLILSLLRYTGLQVRSLIEILSTMIPEALMGTVEELETLMVITVIHRSVTRKFLCKERL